MSSRRVYDAVAKASVSSVAECLSLDVREGLYWSTVHVGDLRNVLDHLANVERRLAAVEALVSVAEEDRRVAQEGAPLRLLARAVVDVDDLKEALDV